MNTLPHINTVDFHSMGQLKTLARNDKAAGSKAAARQFEAVFIQTMLKSMRQALPESKLFNSSAMRLYMDMFDQQIANDMAQSGSLGFSEIIEKQLLEQQGIQEEKKEIKGEFPMPARTQFMLGQQNKAKTAHEAAVSNAENILAEPPGDASASFHTPGDFIETVWPYARKAAAMLGLEPAVLVAQAALETGWGKHMPKDAEGNSSFNLFGIKSGNWSGESVSNLTHEYLGKGKEWLKERFRAYESVQQSFENYVDFITGNPRYEKALSVSQDGEKYLQELQKAGYATDPEYADKIGQIMNRESFKNAIEAVDSGMSAKVSSLPAVKRNG